MTTDPISILFSSDHHFGSPSNNQEEMADAFEATIFPLLASTDIFFINGDFYDTSVIFDSHGFTPIYDTILKLFALCDYHQVTLRILQGTFSHDRRQGRNFAPFYRNNKFSFDFKFIENVYLEEIAIRDRSLRFLYAQDDLPFSSSDQVIDLIGNKMTEMGWDYVDYACLHGFFDFTCGNAPQEKTVIYRADQFPFVKKIIDVGHVHNHAIQEADHVKGYPMVISNGSFDRLQHTEESPKGLIRVLDYPDCYKAQFIENKEAAIYNSIAFTKNDTTETIVETITRHVQGLTSKRRISLRFVIESVEHRDAIKTFMKEAHPTIEVKFKKAGDAEEKLMIPASELFTKAEHRVAPTPETISLCVKNHLGDDYPLALEEIDRYLAPTP